MHVAKFGLCTSVANNIDFSPPSLSALSFPTFPAFLSNSDFLCSRSVRSSVLRGRTALLTELSEWLLRKAPNEEL